MAAVTIVGLGPAGLERVADRLVVALLDPAAQVILRTAHHPSCEQIAATRTVTVCDDLYESADAFDDVYRAIADRVISAAASGPVIYGVPGSAVVGERAVRMIREAAADEGIEVDVHPGESFLDLVWVRTGCDPIADGAQIVDGRMLPDPLSLHLPTVVTQVDRPEVLADVVIALGRTLPDETPVTVLDALGAPDERVSEVPLHDVPLQKTGERTSLFLNPPPNGWHGLVNTSRQLRTECPWDRGQTHRSLLPHLIEETYETVDAISALGAHAPAGDVDYGAYAAVEEELGDLLLQVVFHATLAEEVSAFSAEEIAEVIRRKLVHRHPHVFGDVVAEDAATVATNWEQIKSDEKGRASVMDDVPAALPALPRAEKLQRRAASVGFDWPSTAPVLAKLREEVEELTAVIDDEVERAAELGDVLFTVVNLARHLGVDPEGAFRAANERFAERFRLVEHLAASSSSELGSMSLDDMDELWNRAKRQIAERSS